LKKVGAFTDLEKAKKSHSICVGKGKMRNKRYVSHKVSLIVYVTKGDKLVKDFKNIPGVDIACVDRLNLLKLAPNGHLGCFIIWAKYAFEKIDSTFGFFEKESLQKKGYVLPCAKMVNSYLARIVNSDEMHSVVRPINREIKRKLPKRNMLKNLGALLKLIIII
jgi:large subunit ribosomal protein L4e